MSELTQCNYCTVQSLKRRYKGRGKVVMHNSDDWVDVYVVPNDEELDTRTDPKTGNHLSRQWKMSCLEISDHCVC